MEEIRPNDFGRKDVRLVVETLAAFGTNAVFLDEENRLTRKALVKLIAGHGPAFASDWLSGAVAERRHPGLNLTFISLITSLAT